MADEAEDVVMLADSLGFERFGVSGGSGGGPHVLACAALLPDRVIRATCAVGIAPLGSPGLERDAWLAGMDPENVKDSAGRRRARRFSASSWSASTPPWRNA